LLDLAAEQLKWQDHVTKSSSYHRLLVIMTQLRLKQVGCVTIKTRNDWSSLYLALGLTISKRRQEDKVFLMNKEEKFKDYHQKLFIQLFLSGICYLLNGFQNPASC